ncbi:MAG: N-acetylmuramoyl-L-alanine amidase, partial [Fusobacteriaceae bacterium]
MKKIALVIGHNENRKGAFSKHLNLSEYEFFSELAKEIKKEIEVDIYTRKYCGSYSKEMSNVLNEVHKQRYDLVLELHF